MIDASLAPAVLENLGSRPPVPWPVIEACGLPEIGPQLAEVSVHLDPTLSAPFVFDDGTVLIRPDRAATVTGAALILREAIELNAVGHAPINWADRILAHATALIFGATTLAGRGEPAALATFSPLGAVAETLLGLHDEPAGTGRAVEIATRIATFLLQRDAGIDVGDRCPDDEILRAARALPLSAPTEVLISSGGDDRQLIDWRRGVNPYGIAPIPTPWITSLGSCTASSPTPRGFAAATRLRRLLIEASSADVLDATVTAQYATMRRTLLAALGVTALGGVEVVFTPSGTDAELIPLVVAQAAGEPVHNVIVGQHEIGSGSTYAAAGRHFGGRLPSGGNSRAGDPLAGFDGSRTVLTTVDLRDGRGQMLSPEQLEAGVEDAIASRYATHRTLLHVVEGSKTGIRLPRRKTVQRWRAMFGGRIDVVVDAAQMRVDQSTAVEHLRSGSMVIVTGSKFFGGPPFSGAVLVPSELVSRVAGADTLPTGVSDYLTRADIPVAWTTLRDAARAHPSPGFILRWEAALTEMRSFHNVSPEIRDEVLRQLAAGLRRTIERVPGLRLVESPYTSIPPHDRRGLDDLPTIFTFITLGSDGRPLTMAEADAVHRLLAVDIRASTRSDDPVVGRMFQLGRPVRIYRRDDAWIGGLRIAVGAPMISEIVFDHSRGRTWTERLDRTLSDVADALHKLELIVAASLYGDVDRGTEHHAH